MIAYITLLASVVAAGAAGFTAWRQSRNWSADYTAKRFEAALERALSVNSVEQNVGVQQLLGMKRRKELRRKDRQYVDDTINSLVGPQPSGITSASQIVVASQDIEGNDERTRTLGDES